MTEPCQADHRESTGNPSGVESKRASPCSTAGSSGTEALTVHLRDLDGGILHTEIFDPGRVSG